MPAKPPWNKRSRGRRLLFSIAVVSLLGVVTVVWLLPAMGRFLVDPALPTQRADAAVVLNTGAEYFPRLMEAASLYRAGKVPLVVINGNRKTGALRELEALGFKPAAAWDEDRKRMLEVLGVPRAKIISISAENVFDTISEALALAPVLQAYGLRDLTIVTSKYHTRRAGHIWRHLFGEVFHIGTAPARRDPFQPDAWWRSGRQLRFVMAEYGGWLFFYWSRLTAWRQA